MVIVCGGESVEMPVIAPLATGFEAERRAVVATLGSAPQHHHRTGISAGAIGKPAAVRHGGFSLPGGNVAGYEAAILVRSNPSGIAGYYVKQPLPRRIPAVDGAE